MVCNGLWGISVGLLINNKQFLSQSVTWLTRFQRNDLTVLELLGIGKLIKKIVFLAAFVNQTMHGINGENTGRNRLWCVILNILKILTCTR